MYLGGSGRSGALHARVEVQILHENKAEGASAATSAQSRLEAATTATHGPTMGC